MDFPLQILAIGNVVTERPSVFMIIPCLSQGAVGQSINPVLRPEGSEVSSRPVVSLGSVVDQSAITLTQTFFVASR